MFRVDHGEPAITERPGEGYLDGSGTTVPTGVGWAHGATFRKTNGTGAADALYVNAGDMSAADFRPLDATALLASLLTATAEEINRAADVSTRIVNAASAVLSVTEASHEGKIVTINRDTGVSIVLPDATGSGGRYRFVVGTTVTSGTIAFSFGGATAFHGFVIQANDGGATANVYEAAGSTGIVLDGSTTGGIKGDYFEFIDIAQGEMFVNGTISSTGTEATPFAEL